MLSSVLLSTLLVSLTAVAKPEVIDSFITLPISKRVNFTGTGTLLKQDLARANHLRARAAGQLAGRDVVTQPLTHSAVSYVADVGVGSPPQTYHLIVDTGSANTWVGARQKYVKTSTSIATKQSVELHYGSGHFRGDEYLDRVTIALGLVISNQSIGVETSSSGIEQEDGILGIGPVELTEGTLSTLSLIPTVTDNLVSQGRIPSNLVGISFQPTTEVDVMNGAITWGGIDSSKFTGSITYTPVTKTSPANAFLGIEQSIKYGTSTVIQAKTAGIVDTGSTLLLLASESFKAYTKATGAVVDRNTGLLRITAAQYANLKSLFFTTNGMTLELTANAQIWPRALNEDIGGQANQIYVIVADLGSSLGEGLDFINGLTFLERFYSVFDKTNNRVGFATTSFTTATTN